jgi:hypothetical protein
MKKIIYNGAEYRRTKKSERIIHEHECAVLSLEKWKLLPEVLPDAPDRFSDGRSDGIAKWLLENDEVTYYKMLEYKRYMKRYHRGEIKLYDTFVDYMREYEQEIDIKERYNPDHIRDGDVCTLCAYFMECGCCLLTNKCNGTGSDWRKYTNRGSIIARKRIIADIKGVIKKLDLELSPYFIQYAN